MLVVVVLYFEVDLFKNLSLINTVNFNPFFYLYKLLHAGRTLLHPYSLHQVPTSRIERHWYSCSFHLLYFLFFCSIPTLSDAYPRLSSVARPRTASPSPAPRLFLFSSL
jgi:hypothetical protein